MDAEEQDRERSIMRERPRLDYAGAIEHLRRERGMTREALADVSGVSASYLFEIERGLKRPSTDVLAKIAAALGMAPSELLAYVETRSGVPAADASASELVTRVAAEPRAPFAPSAAWPKGTTIQHSALLAEHAEGPADIRLLELLVNLARRLEPDDLNLLVDLARRLAEKRT